MTQRRTADLAEAIVANELVLSDHVDEDSAAATRWWQNTPPTTAEIIELAKMLLRKIGHTASLEAGCDAWEREAERLRARVAELEQLLAETNGGAVPRC